MGEGPWDEGPRVTAERGTAGVGAGRALTTGPASAASPAISAPRQAEAVLAGPAGVRARRGRGDLGGRGGRGEHAGARGA